MRYLRNFLIFALLATIVWLVSPEISRIPEVHDLPEKIQDLQKQISTPDPLRSSSDAENAFLTRAGVLIWTNDARAKNGLPALSGNATLNLAANARLKDMFADQYFAHVAPDGRAVADEVEAVHYEYISLGENLALGNFKNDQELVEAWMNSPGHRANILGEKFSEIGIAVGQGTFEGDRTWIAVQVFALPRSACPNVDEHLKTRVESNEAQLDQMLTGLNQRREELDKMKKSNNEEYNSRASEYNKLVNSYNSLLSSTKSLIEEYNAQVSAFNVCLNR